MGHYDFNCVEADKLVILLWLTTKKEAAMSRVGINYMSLLSHQQFHGHFARSFVLCVLCFLTPTLLYQACQITETEIMIKRSFMKDMNEEKD